MSHDTERKRSSSRGSTALPPEVGRYLLGIEDTFEYAIARLERAIAEHDHERANDCMARCLFQLAIIVDPTIADEDGDLPRLLSLKARFDALRPVAPQR